jgi:dipeptidyl aminopeptidase/acylaminoacyl peptidase
VTIAPYGSWPTPFTSASVVAGAVRLGELVLDGDDVLWAEGRPAEAGRTQIVRRTPDRTCTDLLPDGMNARTAVHEYGGGGWWARDGVVWFANWADQRLYRLAPGGEPEPLTPEPATPRSDRFADGDVAPDGESIVCVRERHNGPSAEDVVNEIVRLDAQTPGEPEVLVSGSDFVAAPRLSPDGGTLAWLRWDHPSMPWDATELMVRDLDSGEELVIAGGPDESVLEPRWSPDGALWFVSDRSDWWNLYRYTPGTDIATVVRVDAEIGVPQWQFAAARYARLPDGSVVFARLRRGYDALCVRAPDGTVTELDTPFSRVSAVRAAPDGTVLVVAGSPTQEPGVHRVDHAGCLV